MTFRTWLCAGASVVALTGTGCTGLERELASLTAPSDGTTLLGSWQSSQGITNAANACTNIQWQVTNLTNNSLTGNFSGDCSGGIHLSGTITGQLNGDYVEYQITGNGTAPGISSCPFTVVGTAHVEGDAIRIPYTGTTCLGPAHGEEVLRRPAASAPAPAPSPAPPTPAPDPTPSPAPSTPPAANPFHVAAGPLTTARAEDIIYASGHEFPYLTAPRGSENDSMIATDELLRRMIWHLQLAGYQAGLQRNPSGAISRDKLTVFSDGSWHAFDVFRNVGTPGQPADVITLPVTPASYVPEPGIPD